ncbi:sporulation protein [Stenotrophomonas chelatiphaga]|uniref:Sporulation protein n=1 Tax=Stenotrophomonas chelatiphaga TaxID=517011 RepID=A0A0R0D677_9GAMM|nr:SPOR domain-containing protein [Stenotrophomonas chelatiphaga]KRG77157.1 sporulation protein [Stenotrophomonas chelatiphaga]
MDTSLKQRLIGAIVLVALAVIFLPMLVTGPARNSSADSVPLEVPGAPANAQFETRELPLAAPAGGDSGLRGAAPLQEPAANAAATVDTGPAVAAGNFAVSFGAYASKADADAVIAHLKGAQLPGFSETATINGRQAWRVRVGPFVDRAQAESARLQAVKIRSDVRAEVVTLDANAEGAAATAQAPAATTTPLGGNPVQTQALPESAAATPATATAPPAPKPEPKPTPAPAAETKAVAAKPATPAPAPAAKPEVKPEVKAPAAPAASGVGFAVQLGAFGQAADANALRDKVRAAGFSAFVDQVRTDKGVLSRVRVGPVANRAEADQLKAQVAARVGVAGMVRPHP